MSIVRYTTRKDAVHPYWSIWDELTDTWQGAPLIEAPRSGAGVPAWPSEEGALNTAEWLNVLNEAVASANLLADPDRCDEECAAVWEALELALDLLGVQK